MRPVTVAITGGVAAGKSSILDAFARHGAATRSADDVAHALLAGDEEVRRAISARWGAEALDDRGAIGRIVFSDPAELAWLEALLHPRVRAETDAWVRAQDGAQLVAVEIPLLYETGGETRFDRVVAVTAPAEVRAARSPAARDTRGERLLPDEQKLARADYAYVNDGTLDELDAFVAGVVAELSPSS